jgi:hypothetical protein
MFQMKLDVFCQWGIHELWGVRRRPRDEGEEECKGRKDGRMGRRRIDGGMEGWRDGGMEGIPMHKI